MAHLHLPRLSPFPSHIMLRFTVREVATFAFAMLMLGACRDLTSPGMRGVSRSSDEVDVGVTAGNLMVKATYGGTDVSGTPLTVCPFYARVTHTTNGSQATSYSCGTATIQNLTPGTYDASLVHVYNTNVILSATQQVSVTAGATSTVTLPIDGSAGILTGRVTLNGEPANNVLVCVKTGYDAAGNWTPTGMDQCGWVYATAPSNGTFRFVVPGGSAAVRVQGSSGNVLQTASASVTNGETTDMGTIAVELGTLVTKATYDAADVAAMGLTVCPLYARATHTLTGSVATSYSCGTSTIPSLSVGAYSVDAVHVYNTNVRLADAQEATVTTGGTTTVNLPVEGWAGVVSGRVTLNGQPANNVLVCVKSGYDAAGNWAPGAMEQCGWIYGTAPQNGTFRFLVPGGNASIRVQGSSGNVLHTLSTSVTNGETTDLGTIAVELGNLVARATYEGTDVATMRLTVCPLYARATHTASGAVAASYSCGTSTIPSLSVGAYSVDAVHVYNTNVRLADPQEASVTAGGTSTVLLPLEGYAGLLSGRVTLNGAPGNNLLVCVKSGVDANGNWTPRALEQCGWIYGTAPYNGEFRFLVPDGCGSGQVKGPSGNVLGAFEFCTSAGEETDVGNPVEPADDTPPVVTPTVTGTAGSNGWYTSDVTVSWSVTDPESDITSQPCAETVVSSNTTGTVVSCTGTSAGGSTTSSVTVKRDATPPSITFAGNAGSYSVEQGVNISCTATDLMSGLAESHCPGVVRNAYELAVGVNTLNASASDNAGNTATASASFTVTVTAEGLCALVGRFVANKGIANSLCVKLRNGSTGAFRNELRAQTGKAITAEQAAILVRLAADL